MNKRIEISIGLDGKQTTGKVCCTKNVLEWLKRESANIAKGSEVLDYVALESRDAQLLSEWVHDAGMSLVSALGRYVVSYHINNSGVEMMLSMPGQAKRDVAQSIAESGGEFIGLMLLTKWLTIVAADKAEVYAARASEELAKITTIADERRRPVKYEL